MLNRNIPFSTDGHVAGDALKGLKAHDVFWDQEGRKFKLLQLSSTLANDTTAAGEVLVYETTQIVTNDVSTGLNTTNPIAAGVVLAAIAESTSAVATNSGAKYILVMVEGRFSTVKTDGGDDIVAGDILVADETVDGAVDRLLAAATETDLNIFGKSYVGWALAADVDADNTVDTYVHVRG